MKLQNLFIAAAVLFSTTVINAQSVEQRTDSHNVTIGIPNVALLDLESTTANNNITLNATAPTLAGEKVVFNQTNNDLWINYSSIVSGNATRKVTVQITGTVPSGLDLTVTAAAYSGNGKGTTGLANVNSSFTLNGGAAHTIIESIGSAYTGEGANNGHNLTYKIAQSTGTDSYSELRSDESTTLTITYTLSDI